MVMKPPVSMAGTLVGAATRSAEAVVNKTAVTVTPITPDATCVESVVSALVITLTLPPSVATPTVTVMVLFTQNSAGEMMMRFGLFLTTNVDDSDVNAPNVLNVTVNL